MKKTILTIALSLVGLIVFSQSNDKPQRLKYVTQAPDGSVAMTIYDDSRDDSMKLEAANTFYKYQILDPKTNKQVYASNNKGKECTIDKSKLNEGTYDIRLYTKSFVITSKITVSATRKLNTSFKQNQSLAIAND